MDIGKAPDYLEIKSPKKLKKSARQKSADLAEKSFSDTYKERWPGGFKSTPSLTEAMLAAGKMGYRKAKHALGYNKGGNVGKGMGGPGDKPYIVNPDGTITWLKPKSKAAGGKISKYYAGGGNVITGRD